MREKPYYLIHPDMSYSYISHIRTVRKDIPHEYPPPATNVGYTLWQRDDDDDVIVCEDILSVFVLWYLPMPVVQHGVIRIP